MKRFLQLFILAMVAGMISQSNIKAQPREDLDGMFEDEEEEELPPPGGLSIPPPPPPGTFQPSPPSGNAGFPPSGGSGFSGGNDSFGGKKPVSKAPGKPSSSVGTTPAAKPGKPSLADADIDDISDENYPDMLESFDYPNADISDIIKAISQLTGKNFILEPGIKGKISIVAPTQISVAEAYKAFLTALATHGYTVVRSGKFWKIKAADQARKDTIPTYSGDYFPNADIMITRVLRLKYISAEEINKRINNFRSKSGEITAYEPTNSLIISDYGTNVQHIVDIIKELDKPGFEEKLEVIPVRYARSKDMADIITQIINKEPKGSNSNQFGGGFPRPRPKSGNSNEELSLVAPDDRTNSLIVVGNQAGVDKVKQLVRKLDYRLDPAESGGVFVYYCKFTDAEKLATTFAGLAQTSTTGSSSNSNSGLISPPTFGRPMSSGGTERQNIFSGDVKIIADKNTNTLVITASKPDYEAVLSLLNKIDIARDQVYVEAIIMEMSNNKTRDWNPTYYYLDPSSKGIGRAGFSRQGSLSNILNPSSDSGAILGFGGGSQLQFDVGGKTVTVPSLLAFINLIQQNLETNILSTPQVLALDNEDALIEVGDKVPVAATTTTAANGTTSGNIQMEDASIKLEITPHIGKDSDVVRMKIQQTIKQLSNVNVKAKNLADSAQAISNRTVKTNIVVGNGDTAVLGGLVRDAEEVTESKVPLLGDVPVLGWLFKSKKIERNKVNLVVFLTPKIIRNAEDSQKLLSHKTNERIDWIKRNAGGRDPYGDKVDKLPRSSATANAVKKAIEEPIRAK